MDIYEYYGEDWNPLFDSEGWRIGMVRYGKRFSKWGEDEKHLLTDESFILLEGEATLYVEEESFKMEKCKVYNVKKGEWHHITVSPDATVLVVENSNTTRENTEKRER